MRGRRFIILYGGAAILLSGSTFAPNASIGTVIGTLSVSGSVGWTFTLTSNPGSLFSISGNQLQVANGAIGAGSYPVTIQATKGSQSISASFLLTAASAFNGELDFSNGTDPNNSQYLPLVTGV